MVDNTDMELLIKDAKERGNYSAQFTLANLHYNGVDVPRSYIHAYMWLNIALASVSVADPAVPKEKEQEITNMMYKVIENIKKSHDKILEAQQLSVECMGYY